MHFAHFFVTCCATYFTLVYTYKPKKLRYNRIAEGEVPNTLGIAKDKTLSFATERKELGKEEMKKSSKYYRGIEKDMYLFFVGYDDMGAPSFSKFARRLGITLAELEGYRSRGKFDRAYIECSEIRRDYLIDSALTKRYDPSFVKFLLDNEESPAADMSELTVKVEVV